MKKKITIIISLAISLMLSSCSLGGGRMFFDNDDKIAELRFEQVVKAIQSHDKNALKLMFSKQALDEADDFGGHMDYLFAFFQGKIESYDGSIGPVDEDYEHGKEMKEVVSAYDVKTSKGKYVFFLVDYPINTIHPNNVGIYTLRVITSKDAKAETTSWQERKIPGIYKPKKK